MEEKDVETIIGPTVTVEGQFVNDGDVIVEGKVSGTLKTSKNLRIGEQARIKADVDANNLIVAGEIRGNVNALGKLDLRATGKIYGNVTAGLIAIESGAVLHGKCQMTEPAKERSEQHQSHTPQGANAPLIHAMNEATADTNDSKKRKRKD